MNGIERHFAEEELASDMRGLLKLIRIQGWVAGRIDARILRSAYRCEQSLDVLDWCNQVGSVGDQMSDRNVLAGWVEEELRRIVRSVLNEEGLMGTVSALQQLQTDVATLQTNYQALSTLLNTKVLADIQTAISLIQAGDNAAALQALDGIVDAINTQVAADTTATQAADTSLEGAENPSPGGAGGAAQASAKKASPPAQGPAVHE